jgi:ureidoacrylate peracid hydrolase
MDSELVELVDPGHSVLVVVDVQNDSCHPDGLYAQKGLDITLRRQAADNVVPLVDDARRCGVPIVFTKVSHSPWDQSAAQRRRRKKVGFVSCLVGTWGEALYRVQPRPEDAIIPKRRYSAFLGTDLDLLLRSRQITTLCLTGGGTGNCVEATALHGFMLDYDIVMVADCCGTTLLDDHVAALKRIERKCAATITDARELVAAWERAAESGAAVGAAAPGAAVP